jgi:hypothetical protein
MDNNLTINYINSWKTYEVLDIEIRICTVRQ